MPHPSMALHRLLPSASEGGTPGATPGVDQRAPQLGVLIRAISLSASPIGGLEMLAGLAFGEPRAIVLGLASVVLRLAAPPHATP